MQVLAEWDAFITRVKDNAPMETTAECFRHAMQPLEVLGIHGLAGLCLYPDDLTRWAFNHDIHLKVFKNWANAVSINLSCTPSISP